jgi:carbon monoxide dehydrogenase subunit G
MLIENRFTVDVDPEFLWQYLLDVEKIAPCMPGAELTEVVDDRNWKGKLNAKFGPVSLSFAGTVTMEERDDAAHKVTLSAKGMEAKGKGAASAKVTSWLEPPVDGSTTVMMQADITLTGAAAQLSRGLLPEISKKLTQQFADCLASSIEASQAAAAPTAERTVAPAGAQAAAAAPAAAPVAAKPVGGIRLGLSAIWAVVAGFFRRLFKLTPKTPSS